MDFFSFLFFKAYNLTNRKLAFSFFFFSYSTSNKIYLIIIFNIQLKFNKTSFNHPFLFKKHKQKRFSTDLSHQALRIDHHKTRSNYRG